MILQYFYFACDVFCDFFFFAGKVNSSARVKMCIQIDRMPYKISKEKMNYDTRQCKGFHWHDRIFGLGFVCI